MKSGTLAQALAATLLLTVALSAQTPAASRYDNQIQTTVAQKLAAKSEFSNVQSTVEDGIVTFNQSLISISASSTQRNSPARRQMRPACAT